MRKKNFPLARKTNSTPFDLNVDYKRIITIEDCDDVDSTQTLHLTTEDLKENAEPIQLQFIKYQRVSSITLFIEDNQGGDITALGGLKLYGRPVVSTNMSEFKKSQE